MRRELVTGSTSGGYDQLETSPETIEQELRPVVCERRQTDLWRIIVGLHIHITQTIYNFSFSILIATACVGMSLFSVNAF